MMIIGVFLANRIAFQLYQRERQLYQTLDKLNSAEYKKQKYIMGVVHEIKSPVAAVQSLLDLVIKGFVGEVPEKANFKLKRAYARAEEAIELINRILQITQIRLLNGVDSEEIDLTGVIETIIGKTEDLRKGKNLKLNFNKDETNKRAIKGDKSLIELAFSNIIGNSIKYTPSGGKIEVDIKYLEDYVVVKISDDGIGIPENEIDKIFEKNYRASNTIESDYEGSGMGLSLVKEIIEQHKGGVSVKSPSEIGRANRPGVEFTLKLPYDENYLYLRQPERKTIIGGV